MVFLEIMKFLVVDADKANVKYLKDTLQSLGCEVKACKYKEQALSLLHEQKQGFDIVIADVNIPFEMGFKFVEIVSSKMNIPIIMMCSVRDNEIIAAGTNFGACQVAVKPVGIDDARRFWQCALKHRRQHLLGVGNSASNSEGLRGQEIGSNQGTIEGQIYKDRFVWTEDNNALFIEAVHALGGKDLATPKNIMDRMNVPNLTRENIASHLQKYRLYSDPNYLGGKRKRKPAQAMQVGINEQAPVVAHPNRCVLSFEAPEFGVNAQNVSTQQQFGQIEGTSRRSQGMNSDSTQVNGMAGYGKQQGAYMVEPEVPQFRVMSEGDTRQHMYSSPNVQPYVPEPPAESMMRQGMAVPEVFGYSLWPSFPAQSSLALQVPSDGIRSEETPTIPDPELMDLSDPNFPFFDEYPLQEMSMIYGGLSNGLHDNNYPVGQPELRNGDLSSLNDRITNNPATDSLIIENPEANNPLAMHYPQNFYAKEGIVDHSNSLGQQQEQISGTPQEQPGSWFGQGTRDPLAFGQGTSESSLFGQGTKRGYVWFGPKPQVPHNISHHYNKIDY